MATAQELMEQNPKLSQAVDGLEEATLEEQVLAKLKEIEAILTKLDSDSIDLSVFLEQIQSFSDEKKAELQALVDKLDNPLGNKTITTKTFCKDFMLLDGCMFYQEIYKKDGVITKYGDVYFNGYVDSELGGFNTFSTSFKRQPLPNDVEFDMIGGSWLGCFARPKAGQSDKGGVSGSLDNRLFVWGKNASGQLGTGDSLAKLQAVSITLPSRVKDIAIGTYNASAAFTTAYLLLENGDLYSCGDSTYYQLGFGNTIDTNTFQKLASNVLSVFATHGAVMYVSGNDVYACGWNSNGMLGVGTTSTQTSPKIIKTLSNPQDFKCTLWNDAAPSGNLGLSYMLFDGSLYGAGYNQHKAINSNINANVSTPTKVEYNSGGFVEGLTMEDSFCTMFYSGWLLKKNGSNFDLYSGGYGYLGDSTSLSVNRCLKKIQTFNGDGWKMFEPSWRQEVEISYIVIYNEKTREIWACGNDGILLGVGANGATTLKQVVLPKKAKDCENFEVCFGSFNGYGGIFVVIDDEIWACGYANSSRLKGQLLTMQNISKEM